MKPSSHGSSSRRKLVIAAGLLLVVGTGCESLQRKFVRKPKEQPKPTPIIQFHDYNQGMTPLDRYRKHLLLFQYWNDELLSALRAPSARLNQKAARRTSAEALGELRTMRGLLQESWGASLDPLIREREAIDQALQHGTQAPSQADQMRRMLETQTRQVNRDFGGRDIQDRLLNPDPAPTTDASGD